jgi:predicted aldo/keto reductase-like oxidoreductase
MQDRRKFLKNSLLTVTGAGLVSRSHARSLSGQESLQDEPKLLYRTLGKTGIRLPVISMGTGNTDNPNLVRSALDKGVKLLATSEAYQNGNNESMVGSVLKDRPRDSFIIMTSSGDMNWIDTKTGVYKEGFDTKAFLQRVDESLKRLEVDYVDIFIQPFAATRESVFHKPVWKTMETIKKSGKAKYLGIATHRLEHEAIRAAVDIGIYDVIMTAYNFRRQGWGSMQNGEKLDEAIQFAAESGLGIIAMKTMAGVYWDKERTKPINATAALKWVMQNKDVHTTVPDCSTYDQLDQDLAIMDNTELTEQEKQDLKPPSEDLSSGLYCQQCNKCISQCPEAMDIPTIMRSYMYAYGYKNLELAHKTISSTGLHSFPCSACSHCNVECPMGFDVRSKILDIARLKDIPEDFIRYA